MLLPGRARQHGARHRELDERRARARMLPSIMDAPDPTWTALRGRLAELARATRAHNAYIFDARATLVCSAHTLERGASSRATEIVEAALATVTPPLRRGGRLDRVVPRRLGHGYVRFFAAIYVLLLRFSGDFDANDVRAGVAATLPEIERLTLGLPPAGGPGSGGAEGFGVA